MSSTRTSRNVRGTVERISNEQAAVAALRRLGGDLAPRDAEEIAIEVDQLAPGRFRWRTRTDQIDLGLVRDALRDAKKSGWVRGGAREGWSLTDSGLEQADRLLTTQTRSESRQRRTPQERAWMARERPRLLIEDAYLKATKGQMAELSERDLLRFFRLDEYVVGSIRQSKIDRVVRAFADDPELGPVVSVLAERTPR